MCGKGSIETGMTRREMLYGMGRRGYEGGGGVARALRAGFGGMMGAVLQASVHPRCTDALQPFPAGTVPVLLWACCAIPAAGRVAGR